MRVVRVSYCIHVHTVSLKVIFCLQSLESEVDDGRLRTVFCKWSRVDAEADPTYPSSLTSKALLADVQQRSWEDGGWWVVGVSIGRVGGWGWGGRRGWIVGVSAESVRG